MKLVTVKDRKSRKEFLKTPKVLYKDDDTWVCPLDKEIDAIFDPKKNVYYKHAEEQRWVLKDDNNNLIGRITAFVDHNTVNLHSQPTGGIGFFECIDYKDAAFLLFDTSKEWLKDK